MKTLNPHLPTIGILIFDKVQTNEMVAPMDVFTKKDVADKEMFNVVLIAKLDKVYVTAEGLKVIPDYTIQNSPILNVLVVPGSSHTEIQTTDTDLIGFIIKASESTDYLASHCAGAFMLGASGVAEDKQVVTYCSGAEKLQHAYPGLKVMDDTIYSVVMDGKIISSNGNLVSYLASLDLLEVMASPAHRIFVEEQLLLNKLKQ